METDQKNEDESLITIKTPKKEPENMEKSLLLQTPSNKNSELLNHKRKIIQQNPRKMRMKEFESYMEKDFNSIDIMLRQTSFSLKRYSQDSSSSEGQLLGQVEEAIAISLKIGDIYIKI